ncbi:MAG TPA: ferrous iron transport protein B [Lachnospiraceae bacterium]|nr:ferrous iron transport protein B [Lachnospiraceae bacterium]
MTLKELKEEQSARILKVGGEGALRQHFLDMGVIPGAVVTVTRFAPLGDPMEIRIHGYQLTLRLEEAGQILVERIEGAQLNDAGRKRRKVPHPFLGEPGIHHQKEKNGTPRTDHKVLTFALVGNQNSGKTTLFNQLTGANQHVGNFPGVTVDRKDGAIRGHADTRITDLPGIYSMSPYSSEEIVSRNFVMQEKPDAVINIVDATNIKRNLYLTMQLLEMDVPVVIALNMMDEMTENGGAVDINAMEHLFQTPVVPISAAKNQGVHELVSHAIHIAKYQEKPGDQDFCMPDENGRAVHRCLHAVQILIEDDALRAGIPLRFAATKAIEGDPMILDQLDLDQNERATLDHIARQMETKRGLDRCAAIADMRFSYIDKVCEESVVQPRESKEHLRSERIDRILTGKWTAIPVFIGIMGLVFFLTFHVIGAWLQSLIEAGVGALTYYVDAALTAGHANAVLHSLIIDGIFEGVGSVLSFLPIVVVMFFFLSILEDSGYIARVAFFMDNLLRRIGLSGRSIVPMLIGFGCSVPAVMATRTLPSDRDRRMTILLTPFMSCTAKLPIYAFFAEAFFPKYSALVMILLYVVGILFGILFAFLYKKFLFKGEAVPFVMELPNYRLPSVRSTLQLMWEKAKDFLQKAFSVILIATVIVWFLQRFSPMMVVVKDSSDSIMAAVSSFLVPLMRPVGLGDWKIVTSLISGFMAKESVVSVLKVLFGGTSGAVTAMSAQTAAVLLVFCLLYTPCVAAVASIRREMGNLWAAGVVIWQCIIAWVAALGLHLILGLF